MSSYFNMAQLLSGSCKTKDDSGCFTCNDVPSLHTADAGKFNTFLSLKVHITRVCSEIGDLISASRLVLVLFNKTSTAKATIPVATTKNKAQKASALLLGLLILNPKAFGQYIKHINNHS